MQVVGLRPLFIVFILTSSSFLIIFSDGVNAESKNHSLNDGSDFHLIEKQGEIYSIEDFSEVKGISPHESPFFTYRVEGFDVTGNYFFGTTKSIMSESLHQVNNPHADLWEWRILIDIYSQCSCIIHISQLDSTFEVIESASLAVWIKSQNEMDEELSYPIFIEDNHYRTSDSVDNSPLEFNNQLNIYADIYYPLESMGFNTTFDEGIPVGIFDYVSSEINYIDNESKINTSLTHVLDGRFKIHFSMNLESYSEGLYWLDFNSEIISRWDITYFFEIDRTLPIPIINAADSVNESLEWVFVNASASFDPSSAYDLLINNYDEGDGLIPWWTFEEPNGVIRVPNNDMMLSPYELQFLPLIDGDYTFTVYITDKAGNINQTSQVINVKNIAPIGIISISNDEIREGAVYDYNHSENEGIYFSAELSLDSINEIEALEFAWYLDGVLYSSDINAFIAIGDLNAYAELKLVVRDSDGDSDTISISLNQLDATSVDSINVENSNTNFMNGLNLVLLTAFFCTIILLFVKRKSIEENPLPKWSKYNKKQ